MQANVQATKVVRMHIKPDGARWIDFQIPQDQDMTHVFSALRAEGAIVAPGFMLPMDGVLYAVVYINGQSAVGSGKVLPFKVVDNNEPEKPA